MENIINHYVSMAMFTGFAMCLVLFLISEYTIVIIAAFIALFMAKIYRDEYIYGEYFKKE